MVRVVSWVHARIERVGIVQGRDGITGRCGDVAVAAVAQHMAYVCRGFAVAACIPRGVVPL
jgi:hypothetical protein